MRQLPGETWVREHGDEYGADRGTVFVAGSSAGGHLASLAALTPNAPEFQPGRFDSVVDAIEAFAAWVRSRRDAPRVAGERAENRLT